MLVDSLLAVEFRTTLAPETSAPFGSVISPSTEALLLCENTYCAVPEIRIARMQPAIFRIVPGIAPPEFLPILDGLHQPWLLNTFAQCPDLLRWNRFQKAPLFTTAWERVSR